MLSGNLLRGACIWWRHKNSCYLTYSKYNVILNIRKETNLPIYVHSVHVSERGKETERKWWGKVKIKRDLKSRYQIFYENDQTGKKYSRTWSWHVLSIYENPRFPKPTTPIVNYFKKSREKKITTLLSHNFFTLLSFCYVSPGHWNSFLISFSLHIFPKE